MKVYLAITHNRSGAGVIFYLVCPVFLCGALLYKVGVAAGNCLIVTVHNLFTIILYRITKEWFLLEEIPAVYLWIFVCCCGRIILVSRTEND